MLGTASPKTNIMKNNTQEYRAVADAQSSARPNISAGTHKALRALMADTLVAMGRLDPSDAADVATVTGQVLELLDFCSMHLSREIRFINAAVEARESGAGGAMTHDYSGQLQHIESIKYAVVELWSLSDTHEASSFAQALYRDLALFVAASFQHMHVVETSLNSRLLERYTDAELVEIQNTLTASIPPADLKFILRWMVPHMNPAERVSVLSDLQEEAPSLALAAVPEIVQTHLTVSEWAKLSKSLGGTLTFGSARN
jgi:hypothetical protein